ncbi:MAG: 3-deoxy-D-manno-octulosonic acid transferase, partial [Phycisphaerae bacterium]|nr:3-deoxy-D-manno-octulosonic acid transferase [Phycisphaerae bacterium]
MRYILDVLYLIALVLYSPVLLYRILVVGKDRHGWGQRFGRIPARDGDEPLVWIHAVSMGEANSTPTLVDQLRREVPGCRIAISTTTDTGTARAAQLYPDAIRFRFPLDFSCAMRRVFRRLRPSAIVLVELEVWPNLTAEAERRGVPVIVVNGRLTARSFKTYRRARLFVRPMFSRVSAVCAQEQAYAERFAAMGTPADRISVTGSVKYDTAAVGDRVAGQDELASAMGLRPEHVMLIAGSTAPGEEEILLRVYAELKSRHPQLRLAIVPRHPQRFNEVAGVITRAGFACWRRSEHKDASASPDWPADTVVLGDTMGELRKFYALSQVAFVGRSLVPLGGSDMIEVAALGKGAVVGPHTDNFVEPVARLSAAGGLAVVRDEAELQATVDRLLGDAWARAAMATAARQAVVSAQGATARTVA